nr:hypothetical protein [Planctomycetota bacterium]
MALPQDELASKAQREGLAKIRLELAALGQREAVLALRRALRNLGGKDDELMTGDAACSKALAKRSEPKAVPKRVVDMIRKSVDDLAAALPQLQDDAKIRLAFEVLALDADHADANAILGRERVEVEGVFHWWSEDDKKSHARRAEIQAAVLAAKRFDPKIEVDTNSHQ